MAVFRAFRALRPLPAFAAETLSPPYDVVDRESALRLAAGKPHSHLHICRAEIDLPADCDPYGPAVYAKALSNMEQAVRDGVLKEDERPGYYLYRQVRLGRARLGFVGCVSVDDYLSGVIKKHEVTLAEKEEDRVRHFDRCSCHTEPVFLAYRSNEVLSALAAQWSAAHPAEYDVTDPAGVRHQLWPVFDADTIEAIRVLFEQTEALYIADGHHRCASAARVGLERRKADPAWTGAEEYNFFPAVCFPEEELEILDYRRMVKDLNGMSPEQFLQAVEKAGFTAAPADADFLPAAEHEMALLLPGAVWRLSAKPEILSADPVEGLDVSLLQKRILAPLLGIEDPRRDKRIAFTGGEESLAVLRQALADGSAAVAFLLCPVRMGQIMDVADAGKTMPPKSTWFEPKLGSGLFLHRF